MNNTATGGKNVQTEFSVADMEGAYEMGPVSPSAPLGNITALFSSSAPRQRTPVTSIIAQPQPRTARNYGGRRTRYRWPDGLKPWQVHQLHAADAVASQIGLPLNVFVTVSRATMPSALPRAKLPGCNTWRRVRTISFAADMGAGGHAVDRGRSPSSGPGLRNAFG